MFFIFLLIQLCLGRLRVLNMLRFIPVRSFSPFSTTSRERNRVWMLDNIRSCVLSRFVASILIGRIRRPGSHWLCPSSSVSYASTVPRRRPILIVVKWHSHWDSQTLRRQRCGRTSNMWRQRWFLIEFCALSPSDETKLGFLSVFLNSYLMILIISAA